MLAMVLVNTPGTWSHVYPPLRHAEWHGCTPTDLIFPFFLFAVGAAMAFSLARAVTPRTSADRQGLWPRIFRRSTMLIVLGLLLAVASPVLNTLLRGDTSGFANIRLPGVLQRIALCYVLACAVVLLLRVRWQVLVAASVLLAYWALLVLFPVPFVPPTPAGAAVVTDALRPGMGNADNWSRFLDLIIFGQRHLYSGNPTDPEGLLSTFPAVVTVLAGYWTGLFIRTQRPLTGESAMTLGLVGVLSILVGLILHTFMPINKSLWTPSYVVFTAGCAIVALTLCLLICDLRRIWPVARPLEICGLNAILLFVGSGLLARVLGAIRFAQPTDAAPNRVASMQVWLYENLAMPLAGGVAINASLLYALANCLIWLLILWALARKGWYWKV
jgi:predicted acyltransferase